MNNLKKVSYILLTLFFSFVLILKVGASNPSKGTTVLVSQGGSNPSSSVKYQFETKTASGATEKKYISSMYFLELKILMVKFIKLIV